MKINNRLLIVDDDKNIHEDFVKILNPPRPSDLDRELVEIETSLFDQPDRRHELAARVEYNIDHAYQGDEALAMVAAAEKQGRPYSLMFSDVRIPPGIDGIQLVRKAHDLDPLMQVVVVTAFSDYSWEEITEIFGWTDQLLILRKPVDPITVKQVALMLTRKWSSEQELRTHREQLENMIGKRTQKLMLANERLSVEISDRQAAERALQRAHTQLERTNRELQFEINQRKQTEDQQKVLLEDLRTANAELESFAYVVSHDLKAPLRAIHSISSWLAEDFMNQLGEEGNKYLEDLLAQTRWMHDLIEGILQYSRLGRVKSDLEVLDTAEVVAKLIEVLAPPPEVDIEIGELPELVYDRTHFEQVMQNLIENALKHANAEGCRIAIDCKEEATDWCIHVEDSGPGIAERHHDRIFKIFQTLEPRDSGDGSTGIGLSLVKKIVEHHGGRVWVTSEVDRGARFSFTIPKGLRVRTIEEGLTVLTVDDNRDFGDVATAMLQRAGYRPMYASTGKQAVEIVTHQAPAIDVVLLDMSLPGERVHDLYRQLRAAAPAMRIIACTGELSSETVARLRQSGIDGVLPKPFNIHELEMVLQRLGRDDESAPITPHGQGDQIFRSAKL